MKRVIMSILTVFMTVFLLAQAPQKMSYQAVVRNSAGELVKSHAIGMKVSILQGSETGTAVYTETLTPSTNANGLVTVEIGAEGVDWSAGPYFVKTETDPEGGTNYAVVGTSKLLSVPYALYAKEAENGFSGDYNDLDNKPVLFDGQYTSLLGLPQLFDGNYNSLTNKPSLFDGTWIELSGKPTTLTGYGITDAMSTSHPANEITEVNKQYWNLAHSWGDHSLAGYLKTFTETDPYFIQWFDLTGQDDARPYDYMGWNGTKWVRTRNTFAELNHNHPVTDNMGTVGFMSSMDKLKLDIFPLPIMNGTILVSAEGSWEPITIDYFATSNHGHNVATTLSSGFMSNQHKTKLDGLTVADGSETKINASTGITVKGNGTAETPYSISMTQHTIGEVYGGGVIFYVYDNGYHGLIAANSDATINGNPNLTLLYGGTVRVAGSFGNGVGAGSANTPVLVAMQAAIMPSYPMLNIPNAAYACINYLSQDANGVRNGDWYLPSQYEMVLLSNSTATIPQFSKTNPYWSSTETIDNPSYAYMVVNGSLSVQDKRNSFRVRPIRQF